MHCKFTEQPSMPQAAVKRYFDSIATGYGRRYQAGHSYYPYFFNQRLEAATSGFFFNGKSILDVGAGTGALYDWLCANAIDFQYFATDISGYMLAVGNIPEDLRFCGEISKAPLPCPAFDFIFLLGVTSYMSRAELTDMLAFLSNHLAPGGKLVVSFTHRCSLDFQLRRLLRVNYFLKWFKSANSRVIGQPFQLQAYCHLEIIDLCNEWKCSPPNWLNQTVTPFNHLAPGMSVFLAKWLKQVLPGKVLRFFSGDLLVNLRKVETGELKQPG